MNYYKFEFTNAAVDNSILLAFLSQLEFDSFEEKENILDAYIAQDVLPTDFEDKLQALRGNFSFDYQKTFVPGQNWNKDWEANFKPILIDNFCLVKADFHDIVAEVEQELIINPKMAFGTAHHETTYMMIETMRMLDWKGKKVLDYGCGTGILAILASKLGAEPILAIDIEEAAYENTLENAGINGVRNVETVKGDIQIVEETSFDIILANINRNVILESLDTLYGMLANQGKLLISGFIVEDQAIVEASAKKHGFMIENTKQRNNWLCQILKK